MAVIPFASQYVLQQKSYHFLRKTPPSMERREGFHYCRERSLPVTWSIWSLVFVMSASCSRLPPGPKLHLNLSPHFCFLFMAVCKSLWCQKSKDGDNPIVLIQPPSDLNLSYLVASGHRVFFFFWITQTHYDARCLYDSTYDSSCSESLNCIGWWFLWGFSKQRENICFGASQTDTP